MRNTRLTTKKWVAVSVLVIGCLCISYIVRSVVLKDIKISNDIKTIDNLQKANADLQKHADDVNKELQNLQDQLKDLQQKQDLNNKDIQSLKDKVSFLPESMKIDKKIQTVVTAYTRDQESCGKKPRDPGYGMTATGTRAKQYWTVAVDPRVIPLDSMIYIPQFASWPNKGIFHAEDTGARGLFGVDVFVEDRSTALDIGRHSYEVYMLK